MKPRNFVIEYGPTRRGPWKPYKTVKGVRVGAACIKDAEACSELHVGKWVRIRRVEKEEEWSVWEPLVGWE